MFPAPSASFARPKPEAGPAWLVIVATVVLTLFFYLTRVDAIGTSRGGGEWIAMTRPAMSLLNHNLAAAFLLGLVPVMAARVLMGMRPGELGLAGGNPRRGLAWMAVGVPVAILLGKLSAGHPDVQAVYPLGSGLTAEPMSFLRHALTQLAYYASWEILFRGVLLQGLCPRFGFAGANALQTALSVVAHLGRPMSETMAAIPAGLALGGVVRHTGSVWYIILIHWVAGISQDWFLIH